MSVQHHRRKLPAVLSLLTLVGTLMAPSVAMAGKRRAVRPMPLDDSLVITIDSPTGGGAADYVDLGVASAAPSKRQRAVRAVTAGRKLSLRIDRTSGVTGDLVTLRAWLRNVDSNVTVRVNGIQLGPVPRIIDLQVKIGRPITINLEADVSSAAAEGRFLSSIEWEAATN